MTECMDGDTSFLHLCTTTVSNSTSRYTAVHTSILSRNYHILFTVWASIFTAASYPNASNKTDREFDHDHFDVIVERERQRNPQRI